MPFCRLACAHILVELPTLRGAVGAGPRWKCGTLSSQIIEVLIGLRTGTWPRLPHGRGLFWAVRLGPAMRRASSRALPARPGKRARLSLPGALYLPSQHQVARARKFDRQAAPRRALGFSRAVDEIEHIEHTLAAFNLRHGRCHRSH